MTQHSEIEKEYSKKLLALVEHASQPHGKLKKLKSTQPSMESEVWCRYFECYSVYYDVARHIEHWVGYYGAKSEGYR